MELNDAFAAHLGLSSVEELKTKMEEQINYHKQNDIDKEYLDKLIAQIVSASTIEVSPEEIERSRQRTLNFYTNSVAQYGMTLDAYIQAIGMTKQQFDEAMAKEAIQGAKTSALTQYIANRENLIPSEAQINKAISDIRNHYKLSDEQVNEFIRDHREDLIQDLSAEKVANFLLENND
jgi:trigger factor